MPAAHRTPSRESPNANSKINCPEFLLFRDTCIFWNMSHQPAAQAHLLVNIPPPPPPTIYSSYLSIYASLLCVHIFCIYTVSGINYCKYEMYACVSVIQYNNAICIHIYLLCFIFQCCFDVISNIPQTVYNFCLLIGNSSSPAAAI